MEEAKNNTGEPVARWLVFIIGFSAGMIAILFPRVFALLTTYTPKVHDEVLTSGPYLALAAGFAMMIGISMVWIYGEAKETTKNLFFAALALPAVLSGGMNMSSSTASSQKELDKLSKDYNTVLEQVKEQNNVVIPTTAIEIPDFGEMKDVAPVPADKHTSLMDIFIPNAYAEADDLYMVTFGNSKNAGDLEKMKGQLEGKGVAGLKVVQAGSDYYLLMPDKNRESVAVKETLRLREQLKGTNFQPNLLKVK